jgi:hypothetical protein
MKAVGLPATTHKETSEMRARADADVTVDDLGAIERRWLAALHVALPKLAKPIAIAMVQGAARGTIGHALSHIENGLIQIQNADLGQLTGSEVKVLTAILRQMNQSVIQLEDEIDRLYVAGDN